MSRRSRSLGLRLADAALIALCATMAAADIAPPRPIVISANARQPEALALSNIQINAYHSDTCDEVSQHVGAMTTKPTIISDDGSRAFDCHPNLDTCEWRPIGQGTVYMDLQCVKEYVQRLKAGDAQAKTHHFEHLALALDQKLEAGEFENDPLDSWNDLAAVDQDILRYLRTQLDPSDRLEYPGHLSTVGQQIYWSGNTVRPVRLLGFSIYGAVVGDHVNPDGYLDTIAWGSVGMQQKGVNFTRIFLVDQWAALAQGADTPVVQGEAPWRLGWW